MPSRNILKPDAGQTYYHVYARGASKRLIFLDENDYSYFLGLFARYLSTEQIKSPVGTYYPHFRGRLSLVAYCLMPNHFHCLLYQVEKGTMAAFMRSLMTSYSRYLNLKYGRSGSPFESTYKASMITTHTYLEHISRYIHLNPRRWKRYPYSSLQFYAGGETPEWIQPDAVLSMFANSQEYVRFVGDYEGHKKLLDEIKNHLANQ